MAIGDIKSTARGSGARYNDGKPAMELLPISLVAELVSNGKVRFHLQELGGFQMIHNPSQVKALIKIYKEHIPAAARVFDYGRHKYAEWNWLKGMPWSVPLGCAVRHLLAIEDGEELDRESGLPHWGHVMCNLIMLVEFAEHFPEGNDLPKRPEKEAS